MVRASVFGCVMVVCAASALQQRPETPPVYSKSIAPVFRQKCMPCHRPGGPGPFSLMTGEQIKRNLPLVEIQALSGNMPPTPFDSDFGPISHTPPLTDTERILLQRWIQAGAKMDQDDPDPKPVSDIPWTGEEPDLKVTPDAAPKAVRPEGAPYWQAVVMNAPADLREFSGFRFRSNSPKALRRVGLAIVDADKAPMVGTSYEVGGSLNLTQGELVGISAPGYRSWQLPSGASRMIPPGSKLLVLQWLHPTGKPEDAGFTLEFGRSGSHSGLVSKTLSLVNEPFTIEPYSNPVFRLEHSFSEATSLVSLWPEARFYCSKIDIDLVYPHGEKKKLFLTYRWDPLLMGNFQYAKPVAVPAGSKLIAEFSYNNDKRCPMNEDGPPEQVNSGTRTEDEACRLHLNLLSARD